LSILYTRGALRANLLKILATEDTEEYLIKSFCGGGQMFHGAVFSKSAPLVEKIFVK
jgi:hypothetical protein